MKSNWIWLYESKISISNSNFFSYNYFLVIGYEVSAPGVEQYKDFVEEAKHEKDEVIEHSYYQWVGVVLFLQALTFYVAHLFWKAWEKSKCFYFQNLINSYHLLFRFSFDRQNERHNKWSEQSNIGWCKENNREIKSC